MFTFSKQEIEALQEIQEFISGRGGDYPLVEMISYKVTHEGSTVEEATKMGIAEYLCFNTTGGVFLREYLAMNIDGLIYLTPKEDMPLYINCTGKETIKKIVALWRLKIGK